MLSDCTVLFTCAICSVLLRNVATLNFLFRAYKTSWASMLQQPDCQSAVRTFTNSFLGGNPLSLIPNPRVTCVEKIRKVCVKTAPGKSAGAKGQIISDQKCGILDSESANVHC